MLNQLNQDPITNQDKYSDQVEELVQEINSEVSSLIRKMVLKAHTKNSDGLKFKLCHTSKSFAVWFTKYS